MGGGGGGSFTPHCQLHKTKSPGLRAKSAHFWFQSNIAQENILWRHYTGQGVLNSNFKFSVQLQNRPMHSDWVMEKYLAILLLTVCLSVGHALVSVNHIPYNYASISDIPSTASSYNKINVYNSAKCKILRLVHPFKCNYQRPYHSIWDWNYWRGAATSAPNSTRRNTNILLFVSLLAHGRLK